MANDKTLFDPGATMPEGGGAPASNESIQKGDTIIDTYKVESNAIEGGMGSVWRVHHNGWNTDLAMKRPQPQCFASENSKARFTHECEHWINLGLHPNIVSCYYVREIYDTPTIFSEWMDGGSLESAIHKGTLYKGSEAAQQERILDIAIQFARGLHYAHEAGLIHQDVKPDNLLLTHEGEAKMADFGLANARAALTVREGDLTPGETADGGMTIASPSGGYTFAYCSMEQMDGKVLSRRTDIYSWAVSVMEMYVGSRPWANGVVAGLSCEAYLTETRVPISPELRALLVKCMATEPDDRPHDFAQVETELLTIYRAQTGRDYPRPAPKAAADTADSLNNRALSYLDLGMNREAERCFASALEKDKSKFLYHYNYEICLWNSRRISDAELKKRFETHNEASPLWARTMALFALMQRDEKGAAKHLELLRSLAPTDTALPALDTQLQAVQRPLLEEKALTEPATISVDGRFKTEGYKKRSGLDNLYGYTVTDTVTGEVRDYPNRFTDYGTERSGNVHPYYPKNDHARFVGAASEIIAVDADALWLFDAMNGRLLLSLPPYIDSDGDADGYFITGYTKDGQLKYKSTIRMSVGDGVPIKLPSADITFPYELAKIVSIKERLESMTQVEQNYTAALACFGRKDYSGAFTALNRSFETNVLTTHEPSMRLWSAISPYMTRGKLAVVVPTGDEPTPLPQRSPLSAFPPRHTLETFKETHKNRATNGQTDVVIRCEEESEYDSCNEYYDYTFDFSLTACDARSNEKYFEIGYLERSYQSDTSMLERDIYLEFIGENKLNMGNKKWGGCKEIDVSDREYQMAHLVSFALPGGYVLKNTEDGIDIGGFRFDDSFDEMRPLWNADVIPCKRHNYRLIYQYLTTSADEDSGKE